MKGEKPMARGKYKEWLTEDGLKKIQFWFRDGLSDIQVAKNMGISKTTFYDWMNKYPAMSDSVKKGKQPVDFEVENALLKRALGYEIEETNTFITINSKGEKIQRVTKTKKHIAPDTTAAIFWLKNRQPDKWRKMNPAFESKTEIEINKLQAEIKKLEAETDKIGNQSDKDEATEAMLAEYFEELNNIK